MPVNLSCYYGYLWEGEARKQRVCAQPGNMDREEVCSLQTHIEGTGLREVWSVGQHSCGMEGGLEKTWAGNYKKDPDLLEESDPSGRTPPPRASCWHALLVWIDPCLPKVPCQIAALLLFCFPSTQPVCSWRG